MFECFKNVNCIIVKTNDCENQQDLQRDKCSHAIVENGISHIIHDIINMFDNVIFILL